MPRDPTINPDLKTVRVRFSRFPMGVIMFQTRTWRATRAAPVQGQHVPSLNTRDSGDGRTLAQWNVQMSCGVLEKRGKARPLDQMSQSILSLSRRLCAEERMAVKVEVISTERAVVGGISKLFVTFRHEGEEYRLCSTHFINTGGAPD